MSYFVNRFFISDTHFGHKGIANEFTDYEGKPVRNFASVEEMDETMVENWNKVVKPKDTVYHLGDVAISRRSLPILSRLNGRKILVKGNHDIFPLKDYVKYFEDIRAYVARPDLGFIATHIPIHPDCIERFGKNVHGHLHTNTIQRNRLIEYTDGKTSTFKVHGQEKDPRYICVCVEQINYTPVAFEELGFKS